MIVSHHLPPSSVFLGMSLSEKSLSSVVFVPVMEDEVRARINPVFKPKSQDSSSQGAPQPLVELPEAERNAICVVSSWFLLPPLTSIFIDLL